MWILSLIIPSIIFTSASSFSASSSSSSSNYKVHHKRDYHTREYYALHLPSHLNPHSFANDLQMRYESNLGELDHHHLYSIEKGEEHILDEHRRKSNILWYEKQVLKRQHKRLLPHHVDIKEVDDDKLHNKRAPPPRPVTPLITPTADQLNRIPSMLGIKDPIFWRQWHLVNTVEIGHDLNVTELWGQNVTGTGINVAIVDDGLDFESDDLKDNYFAGGSYDFNDHRQQPKPTLDDDTHGTRCAGEIAAVKNDVCGIGVAYTAKVAGIRILSGLISDADEAISLNYAFQDNSIYSCSWGPPDDGKAMDAPGVLIKRAFVNGVQKGRDGKGSIFVFASGNGGGYDDNCNFDGYTNSIYSITIGAVDRKGLHPYYSELCSAQMVVTYSSGSGDSIHTTDVGKNKCADGHGGTSAAAPLAAGIYALVLSERPDLHWRDLQYLSVETAVPVDVDDDDWIEVANKRWFNHKYGFGKLDAYSIVDKARNWTNVKPQTWFNSSIVYTDVPIPQDGIGHNSSITITQADLKDANFARLEHVQVTVNIEHQCRGDIVVDLVSPSGQISHLATRRAPDTSNDGMKDWVFMSVKHWGDVAEGTWTLMVKDVANPQLTGTLQNWQLTLWAESEDASLAKILPLPGSYAAVRPPQKPTNYLSGSLASATTPPTAVSAQLPTQTPFSNMTSIARPTISKTDSAERPEATVMTEEEWEEVVDAIDADIEESQINEEIDEEIEEEYGDEMTDAEQEELDEDFEEELENELLDAELEEEIEEGLAEGDIPISDADDSDVLDKIFGETPEDVSQIPTEPNTEEDETWLTDSDGEPVYGSKPSATDGATWIPSFDSSKSFWVYGGLAIIILFVASVGGYIFLKRRRPKGLTAEDFYEFDRLPGEDDDIEGGGRQHRIPKARGRDLYDPMRASVDDDEFFRDDDEDEGDNNNHSNGQAQRQGSSRGPSRGANRDEARQKLL